MELISKGILNAFQLLILIGFAVWLLIIPSVFAYYLVKALLSWLGVM